MKCGEAIRIQVRAIRYRLERDDPGETGARRWNFASLR
jgi:hypothetical protein